MPRPMPAPPRPKIITVEVLRASIQGMANDAVVAFEMPNGEIVAVRSCRRGRAHRQPLVLIPGVDPPREDRQAIVLKG